MIDSAMVQGLLGGERRLVVEGAQGAGHPHAGRRARLDMEVRAIEVGQHHENSIEVRVSTDTIVRAGLAI